MDSIEKITPSSLPSRRKFVWGVGAFALMAAAVAKLPFSGVKNIFAGKPESKKRIITMLTQDGKLVQVDESLIKSCRRKANKNELLNWIKK